jgi:hypothetical protein
MTTASAPPAALAGGGSPEHSRLAWFVLFVVGGIILQGQPPPYDEPINEARQFFANAADRYLWGDYIAGIAFILCFLPYLVGLHRVLSGAEPEPRMGSQLLLVGGITTVVVGDTATAFLDAVAVGNGASELADTTLRELLRADAVAIAAIGLPMALTAFAAATVIWRSGVLWRWLAPFAALAGILHVIGATFVISGDGSGPLVFIRFAGLIAFGLFVVFSSIDLLTRADQAQRSGNRGELGA